MYYLFEPGKHPCEVEDVPMPNEVPVDTYLYDGMGRNWYASLYSGTDHYRLWVHISNKDLLARLNTQLLLVL